MMDRTKSTRGSRPRLGKDNYGIGQRPDGTLHIVSDRTLERFGWIIVLSSMAAVGAAILAYALACQPFAASSPPAPRGDKLPNTFSEILTAPEREIASYAVDISMISRL